MYCYGNFNKKNTINQQEITYFVLSRCGHASLRLTNMINRKALKRKAILDIPKLGQCTITETAKKIDIFSTVRLIACTEVPLRVIHKNRGCLSSRGIPETIKNRALDLYQEKY